MIDRRNKVALAVLGALIVVFGSMSWLNSADALVPKCKSDTHIAVVVAAPGVKLIDVAKVAVVHDVPGTCRNVADAPDDYDVTINGHAGMHLLDSAASAFVAAVDADPGEPLTIEHTVNHVLVPWRSFTPAAAQAIADQIGH